MMKKHAAYCAIALIVIIQLSSCAVSKQPAYFTTLKKDTTLTGFISNDFESLIRKGDRISVTATSLNPAEDALFNSAGISASSSASAASGGSGGYTVSQDGTVELHRVGKVRAEGLTRKAFAKNIQTSLLAYMKEPIVTVQYLNHKVTVMGQVGQPQVLNMPDEQITLIDALVLSGDVLPNANRRSITVIRDNGNEKKVKHINLEDHSVFSSPWFYVQPNDIILVSPDDEKYVKEENKRKLQTTLSLAASGISLLIIILDRVIK